MCEEQQIHFNENDIVWIKYGSFWWPGEVKDRSNVPEDLIENLKKEPVAFVKFFDEEFYECVKTADGIFPYNCEKKNDFIKKGMDAFRAKNPRLAKFPKDVSAAEVKTGGNANILSDPIFSPERKRNYVAEIFGSPVQKKSKDGSNKGRPTKYAPHITHRRFLGYNDYEAHIIIQYPGKDRSPEDSDADSALGSCEEPTHKFTCPICKYVTDRLGVIMAHTQCHIDGVFELSASLYKKSKKTQKRKKMKLSERASDVKQGNDTPSKKRKIKNKQPMHSTPKDLTYSGNADESDTCADMVTDIRSNLLAEWDDDSDFDSTEVSQSVTTVEASEVTDTVQSVIISDGPPIDESLSNKDLTKSCFDFEEEEEATTTSIATLGRKIPRVIPPSEKRKSSVIEVDLNADKEHEKISEGAPTTSSIEAKGSSNENDDLEKSYKELMESTSLTEIPEIPNILKSEQNFHCAKTIKFPDKLQDFGSQDAEYMASAESIDTSAVAKSPTETVSGKVTPPVFRQQEEVIPVLETDLVEKNSEPKETVIDVSVEGATSDDLPALSKNACDTTVNVAKTDLVTSTPQVELIKSSENLTEFPMSLIESNIAIDSSESSEDSNVKLKEKSAKRKSKTEDRKLEKDKKSEKLPLSLANLIETLEDHSLPSRELLSGENQAPSHTEEEDQRETEADTAVKSIGSICNPIKTIDSIDETENKYFSEITSLTSKPLEDISSLQGNSRRSLDMFDSIFESEDKCILPLSPKKTSKEKIILKSPEKSPKSPRKIYPIDEAIISPEHHSPIEVMSSNAEGLSSQNDVKNNITPEDVPHPQSSKKSQKEVATKLTNPKKRFVKSFEDFELMQNEQRRMSYDESDKNCTLETKTVKMKDKQIENIDEDEPISGKSNFSSVYKPKAQLITKVSGEKLKSSKSEVGTQEKSSEKSIEKQLIAPKLEDVVSGVVAAPTVNNFENLSEILSKNERTPVEVFLKDTVSSESEVLPKSEAPPKQEVPAENEFPAESEIIPKSKASKSEDLQKTEVSSKNRAHSKKEEHSKRKTENEILLQKEVNSGSDCENLSELALEKELYSREEVTAIIQGTTKQTGISDYTVLKTLTTDGELHAKAETEKESCSEKTESEAAAFDDHYNGDDALSSLIAELNVEKLHSPEHDSSESKHEVHLKCISEDTNEEDFDISIKTNLSNLNSADELAALATLATVSGLKVDPENPEKHDEPVVVLQKSMDLDTSIANLQQPELVQIDGNLTVVSEKDLAEGQVEITSSVPTKNKKPVTLLSFSMDFSDDSCGETFTNQGQGKIIPEKSTRYGKQRKKFEKKLSTSNDKYDTEPKISILEGTDNETVSSELECDRVIDDSSKLIEELKSGESPNKNNVNEVQYVYKTSPVKAVSETKYETKAVVDEQIINEVVEGKEHCINKNIEVKQPIINESMEDKPESLSAKPIVFYNTAKSFNVTEMCDLEDHIPSSQIVCKKEVVIEKDKIKGSGLSKGPEEFVSSGSDGSFSKLLNRLTADKTKEINIKLTTGNVSVIQKGNEKIKPQVAIKPTEKVIHEDTSENTISKDAKSLIKSSIKSKLVVPRAVPPKTVNKAIILSEKIIRPARDSNKLVPNLPTKRNFDKIEDQNAFAFRKNQGTLQKSPVITKQIPSQLKMLPKQTGTVIAQTVTTPLSKAGGKAKILNQTIITPTGEIYHPKIDQNVADDNVFDINSMPIVLSDELLTPESIENMPIVLSDSIPTSTVSIATDSVKVLPPEKSKLLVHQNQPKVLNKTLPTPATIYSPEIKNLVPKLSKTPKILSTSTSQKILKHPTPLSSAKPGKYIIVPQNSGNRLTVSTKKPNLVRRSVTSLTTQKAQNLSSEPTGNKIMIVTNQQGQQQRLLLTPAQQKLFSMQGPKIGKTVIKSNILQKAPLTKIQTTSPNANIIIAKSQSNILPKTPISLNSSQMIASAGQILSPQLKSLGTKKMQKVYVSPAHPSKLMPHQKTILVKYQHGQTVRKSQGTDDALLERQVAEQIEAIKASGIKCQQKQEVPNLKFSRSPTKRLYTKRSTPNLDIKQAVTPISKPQASVVSSHSTLGSKVEPAIPPLTPIVDKKEDISDTKHSVKDKPATDRPLNQLVIQDGMGNQTTITEGQILALPSETADGQPQSYMLVTLDESGNLTPLNNEALMSLDPSLGLGGDLSNMTLQLDQGTSIAVAQGAPVPIKESANKEEPQPTIKSTDAKQSVEDPSNKLSKEIASAIIPEPTQQTSACVQVACNVSGGEPGRQLILTGDADATQKFLDSLSEGNTDLANILASAEGSFIIQADGQQIMINTQPDNQMLLAMNAGNLNIPENTESGGNPMFATQPTKNQDILAAALADTDVFQPEQAPSHSKTLHSQLSPGSSLFPMNVGNVLETSLTLNSPIMTPIEIQTTNSKKIHDEADILSQIPKNVDLPITITDPNIVQTVSQQRVASLMANDLTANLELSLPISDATISVTSTEMNSPTFVYSLPTLEVHDSSDISQKTFSSSMPLLTEDIEDSAHMKIDQIEETIQSSKENHHELTKAETENTISGTTSSIALSNELSFKLQLRNNDNGEGSEKSGLITSDGTFMEEGLCTLGGEMCSSLSEPPPEMFDSPAVDTSYSTSKPPAVEVDDIPQLQDEQLTLETTCDSATNPPIPTNEDSLEIPVQPQIVTDLNDALLSESFKNKRSCPDDTTDLGNKKCKFD